MKLTKQQALDLVKILSHYEALTKREAVDVIASSLRYNLEDYLVNGGDSEESSEQGESDEDHEEEDEEEFGEQEAEESDEDDEDLAEEAEEDLIADGDVSADELHELSACKATTRSTSITDSGEKVTLGFESAHGAVDLLVDGGASIIGPVAYVRRESRSLHVAERLGGAVAWHVFDVSKFPKDWVNALPAGDLLHVDEEE